VALAKTIPYCTVINPQGLEFINYYMQSAQIRTPQVMLPVRTNPHPTADVAVDVSKHASSMS
jgi:hypothetical protein